MKTNITNASYPAEHACASGDCGALAWECELLSGDLPKRKRIVIEIDDLHDSGWQEVLFNAGIGAPENGESWPNMKGVSYRVTSISVEDI